MEQTYLNEQMPLSTNPRKAAETKLISTENNHAPQSPARKKIQLLPEHLIDQIKAGEVIDRPSALLKELIENSIDAGATQIDIRLINAGLDLISVSDDGQGMHAEDLPLAFTRHATSKIERYDDLFHLDTYGFRGEALASAASIARVCCWSKSKLQDSPGGRIQIEGGKLIEHISLPLKKTGTVIQIKDLFFNTPARLEFIRSSQIEKNAHWRVLHAAIVANPHISFTIIWDQAENEIEHYPAVKNLSERVRQILRVPESQLFIGDYAYNGYRIKAYLRKKGTKSSNKVQILTANRRLFFDKKMHYTILKSMTKLWPKGTSGEYFLEFEIPKDKIDVNVHPNKTQLKFKEEEIVSALVRQMCQEACELEDTVHTTPDHHSSKIPNNSVPHLPIKNTSTNVPRALPGWSFYTTNSGENYLVHHFLLILHWWKSNSKALQNQIPLLIAKSLEQTLPFESWKKWDAIKDMLGLGINRTVDGKLLMTAVPEIMQELNHAQMVAPLLSVVPEELLAFVFDKSKALEKTTLTNFLHINTELDQTSLHKLMGDWIDHTSHNDSNLINPPARRWEEIERWWMH